MIKSPSFSRSWSSTTTTISPRPIAATASSTSAKAMLGAPFEESFDVLGDEIHFDVHTVPRSLAPERCRGRGVGDDRDADGVVSRLHDRKAAPVDRDGALFDDIARELNGNADAEAGRRFDDLTDGVDVTLHDVTTQPPLGTHGP